MTYDVAIIGGGIAGLALSIDLRSRGYNVVVIEKGKYPRHKVCGEYISNASQNYLNKICPSLSECQLPAIRKFKLTSGRSEFITKLGIGGFGISRYLLEELLFKQASNKGVEFMLDTKASAIKFEPEKTIIRTDKGNVNSLLVCNSSGRRSNFEARWNDERKEETNYVGVKYHVKLKRDESLIEIHNFTGGYCGISNIENDMSCLCYIVNARYLKDQGNSIPELEKKVLCENEHLKKIFNEAKFIFDDPITISGINFRIKKPVNGQTFFVGDSAGSIAPITGNGMSMALRAASTLAKEIENYFSNGQTKEQLMHNYSRYWSKEFSARISLSRHFQKLAEYPSLTTITIGLFNAAPFLAKGIIRQTHGKSF